MSEPLRLEHVLYEIRKRTGGGEEPTAYTSEREALNNFCQVFQRERDFSKSSCRDLFSQLLGAIKSRCLGDGWLMGMVLESADHAHTVLMALRLLLRDQLHQHLFMKGQSPIPVFSTVLSHLCVSMVTTDATPVDILKELTNIFQKISHSPCYHSDLIKSGVHVTLYQLLECREIVCVQCSLCALINLCKCPSSRQELCSALSLPYSLLHIVTTYDITSRRLATDLLVLLSQDAEFQDQIQEIDGLAVCLRLLHSEDHHILHHMVCVLERLAEGPQLREDVRLLGGIPILINVLSKHSITGPSLEVVDKVLALKAACCSAITQLALSDSNAQLIVSLNGVYLIAVYIIPLATDVKGDQRLKFNLQKSALRTLRYLFSVERNRSLFKKLLPASLFESFIDVGHYTRDLSAYDTLTHTITNLQASDRDVIHANIESTNQNKAPIFTLGGYAVLELLGSGAFGSVYKVRKPHSQTFLALKEIKSTHPSLGQTLTERSHELGRLLNEVNIMKEQLKHTNVVRYHKCFQKGGHLYIVMQFLEGATLLEHIKSLQEKGDTFSERRLWRVFSQLVLALRYIHKEKRVVHRDLSPANVMLGAEDKLTITDFGLAKQKQKDFSVMESVVGTMLYWCPELVQSEPYNEKADMWAAGCILYQMATLHPPFHSTNLLALAKKIVEVDYPPIPDSGYSSLVSHVIARCLMANPQQRADSVQVGAMLVEVLMHLTDELSLERESLERKLDKEKVRSIKHLNKSMLSEQRYQQLLSSSRDTRNQSHARRRLSSTFASMHGSSMASEPGSPKTELPAGNTDRESAEISPADSKLTYLRQSSDSVFVETVRDSAVEQSTSPQSSSRVSHLTSRIRSQSVVMVRSGLEVDPLSVGWDQLSSLSRRQAVMGDSDRTGPTSQQLNRTASASSTLSISPHRLREINDPITHLLAHVHKLIFLTQLPPSSGKCARRQLVETYKRTIFSQDFNLTNLKVEILKLSNGSADNVVSLMEVCGLQSQVISRALSELSACGDVGVCWGSGEDGAITYEQLQAIVDTLAAEHNYSTHQTTPTN